MNYQIINFVNFYISPFSKNIENINAYFCVFIILILNVIYTAKQKDNIPNFIYLKLRRF